MCNFQACIFVAAGWASTSWCLDVAYFTMGLDSLHPSISHNLSVGFLCSYSPFWEISFLFETMQTNPPDNLIDTFEISSAHMRIWQVFSVYFVTRSSVRSAKIVQQILGEVIYSISPKQSLCSKLPKLLFHQNPVFHLNYAITLLRVIPTMTCWVEVVRWGLSLRIWWEEWRIWEHWFQVSLA